MLRAPTQDELKDLLQELLEWRNAQPDAMPPQLWDRIGKLIEWQMRPFQQWTQERKDRVRWKYVRMAIGHCGWEGAFEYASKGLQGTPAAGAPETMRQTYQKIENTLPPQQRRPRTYRRNPRLR